MRKHFEAWWEGTYTRHDNPHDVPLYFVVGGYQKRHWTSKMAHAVTDFWLKYWQWCMGFGLAVIGLWKH
jgi:hypothetical protein